MKTNIVTAHEEEYTKLSKKTLGVLLNINEEGHRVDSLTYIYNKGMYIIFDTMIDMMDYILHGDVRTKRAYIDETKFDEYFDAEFIDDLFTNKLDWTSN